MFNWFRPKREIVVRPPEPRTSFFSTHAFEDQRPRLKMADVVANLLRTLPKVEGGGAMDDSSDGGPSLKTIPELSDAGNALGLWYASQGFIGYQTAALIAQHWLINKACTMPGRDAIRQGYDIVSVDGDELDPGALKLMRRTDRAMKLRWNLEQFIRMGRIFGIRIALFRIDSTDPDYYEKPFNLDGVTPGSYKGIVQIDPYWCAPQMDPNGTTAPDTMHFYEPAFWTIRGKKYHRSHLVIFRHAEPPDLLKPAYRYGGVPVPQQIMERVYAAERTANEAPQLAMTKRTTVWQTDMDAFVAAGDKSLMKMAEWARWRDNYGIKVGDKEADEFSQYDTSLADLDTVIMTQYQIVAAAANVPSTKLLGTAPKGFNATGEYEESSYHEELESIQAHDLTPLIERHNALVMRSVVQPAGFDYVETTAHWIPLDSPTAQEEAVTNLTKAQTGAALIASGAITSEEERTRVATDPASGYHGLGTEPPPSDELNAPDEDSPDEDDESGDA